MGVRRPALPPPDTWPPRMMADMAAAYCGERHVEDFLERVGTAYPQPRHSESQRRRFWYRSDLDKALGIGLAPTGLGDRFIAAVREKRDG
jgi:hypothetical protein